MYSVVPSVHLSELEADNHLNTITSNLIGGHLTGSEVKVSDDPLVKTLSLLQIDRHVKRFIP